MKREPPAQLTDNSTSDDRKDKKRGDYGKNENSNLQSQPQRGLKSLADDNVSDIDRDDDDEDEADTLGYVCGQTITQLELVKIAFWRYRGQSFMRTYALCSMPRWLFELTTSKKDLEAEMAAAKQAEKEEEQVKEEQAWVRSSPADLYFNFDKEVCLQLQRVYLLIDCIHVTMIVYCCDGFCEYFISLFVFLLFKQSGLKIATQRQRVLEERFQTELVSRAATARDQKPKYERPVRVQHIHLHTCGHHSGTCAFVPTYFTRVLVHLQNTALCWHDDIGTCVCVV